MRKSEVEFHSYLPYGGPPLVPAVNVKVRTGYGQQIQSLAEQVARNYGNGTDADLFADYADQWYSDPYREDWTWDAALESAWEMLQTDAEEIFGLGVKVYSAGRSGAWAYVEGLPEFDSWDAIDLAKWARFCKYARAYADDVPYSQVVLLYINTWEMHKETIEASASADLAAAGIH